MPERQIDDLLRTLPDEVAPDPQFAARLRAQLEAELATPNHGAAPAPTSLQEVSVLRQNQLDPTPRNTRWILATAAALVALVLAVGVILVAVRDTDSVPADDPEQAPTPTAPPTLPPVTEAADEELTPQQRAAVDTATTYFEAFGRGDADAVLAMTDLTATNDQSERAVVEWWSIAGVGDGAWPSGECRPSPGSETGAVLVACPLAVTDPVALALGIGELTWSVDVNEGDGLVRRRAEPLTSTNGNYSPVWAAHAEFLAEHRAGAYAELCAPGTAETGSAFVQNGLALNGACADLVKAAAADAAASIDAGLPAADATEIPLSLDAVTGYWTNVGGRTSGWTDLLVDFRRDGTFTIGNTGELGAGAFTAGTFVVDGDTIVFSGETGGCGDETFVWTSTSFTDGALDAESAPNGGCAPDAGWEWVRVSPAGPEALALPAGSSEGAARNAPDSVADVRGVWLRLGTAQVLAIATDGTYLVTSEGDSLAPQDTGVVSVDAAGALTFESDGSGECATGDSWGWSGVTVAADLIREGNPRGTTMRTDASDLCGMQHGPTVWRLLSPDLVSGS